MRNIPSFSEIKERMVPAMDQLEGLRRSLVNDAKKKSLIYSGGILAIAVVISLFATSNPLYGLLFGFIVACIVSSVIFNYQANKLSPLYKKKVIGKLVEELIEEGKYEPETGISEASFNQTALYSRPDRYNSEDFISGKVGKTAFCFAEVHAEEKQVTTNSKGQTQTHWVTLFQGFMFIADFNKDFSGQTIIQRNSIFKLGHGERVKLENPVFEKHFDVFSTDQVEARYILSPSLMEKLIKLDELFGNGLLVSFHHSQIVIMVKCTSNHFEASLWRSVRDIENLKEEYATIVSLTSIIDTLDLNTRIWSKE